MTAPDRTTPMGLWTDANGFFTAARILINSGDTKVRKPTYYLLGHAIELVLKSYLFAAGSSLDFLKRNVGHDLEKAADHVVKHDAGKLACVIAEYTPDIAVLNTHYKSKDLEYRVTEYKRFPMIDRLLIFLEAILPVVGEVAVRSLPRPNLTTQG